MARISGELICVIVQHTHHWVAAVRQRDGGADEAHAILKEMPVPRIHDEEVGERLTSGVREMERKLHPDVIRIKSSFGDDWSGDPAIFFRIVLSDAASRRENLATLTGNIGGQIFDYLDLAKMDYVPYFNFRSESEQKRLKDPEWD